MVNFCQSTFVVVFLALLLPFNTTCVHLTYFHIWNSQLSTWTCLSNIWFDRSTLHTECDTLLPCEGLPHAWYGSAVVFCWVSGELLRLRRRRTGRFRLVTLQSFSSEPDMTALSLLTYLTRTWTKTSSLATFRLQAQGFRVWTEVFVPPRKAHKKREKIRESFVLLSTKPTLWLRDAVFSPYFFLRIRQLGGVSLERVSRPGQAPKKTYRKKKRESFALNLLAKRTLRDELSYVFF